MKTKQEHRKLFLKKLSVTHLATVEMLIARGGSDEDTGNGPVFLPGTIAVQPTPITTTPETRDGCPEQPAPVIR